MSCFLPSESLSPPATPHFRTPCQLVFVSTSTTPGGLRLVSGTVLNYFKHTYDLLLPVKFLSDLSSLLLTSLDRRFNFGPL